MCVFEKKQTKALCWKPGQLGTGWDCPGEPHLPNDALHTPDGKALVVGLDDPLEEMVAKDLEDHADIWATVKDH